MIKFFASGVILTSRRGGIAASKSRVDGRSVVFRAARPRGLVPIRRPVSACDGAGAAHPRQGRP
ncbi:hypothetical protein C725_0980 [Pacificimonas flava]|uniref:Uncharacterized protein n=1 Tax=Pacificimonas flava TaxID=1234595 RepID=M2U7N4_9SPHN|nr:hypothetical protein C725_0980 [Pacificimonas flava]